MQVVLVLLIAATAHWIQPAAAAAPAAPAEACPTAPSTERAQCICSKTALGRDKYIADVGRSCSGAVRCMAPAKYRACSSGRKFDESAQRCVAAANVDCLQAALARPEPADTCSGGPTPDGTCGSNRPGNYCCRAGQCCSLYGICGWTPSHCDVNNGCQVSMHSSQGLPAGLLLACRTAPCMQRKA